MKFKLFYGWYMVIFGVILAAVNASIIGYGWTAFVGPVSSTFGWTMAQMSVASSLRSLEFGVFNPLWGPVVDRSDPKWLMRLGTVIMVSGLICLSQTQNIWMYYAGFFTIGVGGSLVTGMLPITVIARWFKKDIGKASGMFYMGNAFGGVTVPLVVKMIEEFGWRNTILYTAILFGALGLAASFIFRGRPEDYGLVPDGRVLSEDQQRRAKGDSFGTSVKEALKMRAFWHIAAVTLFQTATVSTIMMYAMPYLTSIGMGREWAGTIISIYTFISAFGRIPFGILSDVFRKTLILTISLVLLLAGMFVFWKMEAASSLWFILLFAIPYGLGVSGITSTRSPILAEYFGIKNFGSIFGLTSVFFAIGSIASPPIAGWIYDNYQDYRSWWLILLIWGVFGILVMLTIPRARRAGTRKIPATTAPGKALK
jgi:OFA family oxalate/formate antiporter-like MFS transporter